MEADSETIRDHSPDDSRRISVMTDSSRNAVTASGQRREGFERRRRCVTMSILPDFVALDGEKEEEEEEEEEEDGAGQEEKRQEEEEDVLWMGCKDGAGGEGNFEMRVRAKTSPACMRWYVERQVGRHLRRISDDFISHISQESRSSDEQQSVSPRQPEVRPDSRQLPVANSAFPPSPFSSSRDSLWSRMSTYFRPARPRIQSERVNTNDSNGLSTNGELDEVFLTADVENSPMVAMQ